MNFIIGSFERNDELLILERNAFDQKAVFVESPVLGSFFVAREPLETKQKY